MKPVTTAQMRRLEAEAVAGGLSYLRLMENAGSAAARRIRDCFSLSAGVLVVLLCGRGNNGGDGFVIARKLQETGAAITVVLTEGPPRTDEAADRFSQLDRTAVTVLDQRHDPFLVASALDSADLIVDAVYGIGFHGTLPDYLAHTFDTVNRRQVPVVAVDIPSGLNADTGEPDSHTLRAVLTVTFTAPKSGMMTAAAGAVCGRVEVAAIGIDLPDEPVSEPPSDGAADPRLLTETEVMAHFPPRPSDAHKGTFGHVLVVGGHYGMAGAPYFATAAALRSGAGLVTAALPRELYPLVAPMVPEALFLPLPSRDGFVSAAARTPLREALSRCQALAVGCGLGLGGDTDAVLTDLLTNARIPIVLDADGINWLATHISIRETVRAPLILTPHPGEMARLCGCTIAAVQADRVELASHFARQYRVVLVLKGHHTVIAAPDGAVRLNPTGNPGMATGGSGDLLCGIIASLAAQGFSPTDAALCGVYLHGLAGDRAAQRLSQAGLLPSDMLTVLPELFPY